MVGYYTLNTQQCYFTLRCQGALPEMPEKLLARELLSHKFMCGHDEIRSLRKKAAKAKHDKPRRRVEAVALVALR